MNPDVLKVRAERIKEFQTAAGGGKSGVVPMGMAAFLLAVSSSRIKTLLATGRLETTAQGGQRWILFSSICNYAQAGEPRKRAVSKPGTTKSGVSKLVMSRSGMTK